jgi:hypothetical protein
MTALDQLARVADIYDGSNGDATKALYAELEKLGPVGLVALNLFRAQKNSARAKVYRGGGYRGMAYDRKQWAMNNLAEILAKHAEECRLRWGWGNDPAQPHHCAVLYIDLPTGQVSFHTEARGAGPDYPDAWDGARGTSPGRIWGSAASVIAIGGPAEQALAVAVKTTADAAENFVTTIYPARQKRKLRWLERRHAREVAMRGELAQPTAAQETGATDADEADE